jgi:AraC-like DNA-binding protein
VGHDVLSQPVVSLFFNPRGAYFEGPTIGKRTLVAKDSPIYAGAQFRPGGFYPFWKKRIQELAEKTIPASAVLPQVDDAFIQELLLQMDDQQLISMMEKLLLEKDPEADSRTELLDAIIAYIEASGGMITVTDVASQFSMSERTLQHLFQTYVGVGIKWAIMRVRFLRVIQFAREQKSPDWTAVAAEFGYSDQSHFINDFKRLIGTSPSRFMLNG